MYDNFVFLQPLTNPAPLQQQDSIRAKATNHGTGEELPENANVIVVKKDAKIYPQACLRSWKIQNGVESIDHIPPSSYAFSTTMATKTTTTTDQQKQNNKASVCNIFDI